MVWQKFKSTIGLDYDYKVKPAGLHWRSNTFFIIATVAVGLFTDLFLYGLIVPVLPFLLRDRCGIPVPEAQPHVDGLLSAYAGASVLFSPVAGVIADKTVSRQLPFMCGLFALLLATLILYLGQTEPVLIFARVLQGLSAAVVWTIGLALCLDTVGPENLGKTIGSIFSFIGVGSLIAPVLGGILYEAAGYEGVFGIGAGVLVVDLVMRILVVEKKIAHRYDPAIKDPFQENNHGPSQEDGAEDGEDDEQQPLLGKDKEAFHIPPDQPSVVQKAPLLYCLKDPRLLSALLVALVQATLFSTFDATVTTESENLFGFSSLKSGLLFIPLGVFDLFVGPLAGWSVDRYGTKPAAVIGYGMLVPVLFALRAVHSGGTEQIALYCVLLGFCGIGLAIVGAPSIVEAGDVVNRYHKANPEFFGETGPYAQLYGLNSMVFSSGLTLGPLVMGTLRDEIGYGNMNAVVAAICLVTATICYVFIGGRPRLLQRRQ